MKRWFVHTRPSQDADKSEERTARNHEARLQGQYPKGHAGNKCLNDRMDELLRDSVYKDKNTEMGGMTAAPNQGIYLEAMEETENQIEKPYEAGMPKYYTYMTANSRR